MSEYKKHPIESVDLSILDRISEDEITAWMAARLHKLRVDGVEIYTLDLDCWHRSSYGNVQYYDTRFGGHGGGQCDGQPTVKELVRKLRTKQLNDPAGKAMEKRAKARRLIKEAERLEVIAQSIES